MYSDYAKIESNERIIQHRDTKKVQRRVERISKVDSSKLSR